MQPVPGEPTSPSRRRQRVDSSPPYSLSNSTTPKRPRVSQSPMASAKARGKLPQTVVDLTRKTAFQPYSGAKKLVIKNLRVPASQDKQVADYYVRTKRELESALDAVLAGETPNVPFERLYRGVEDVCRNGDPAKIYELLRSKSEAHLRDVVLNRVLSKSEAPYLATLRSVLEEWNIWNTQTVLIYIYISYQQLNGLFSIPPQITNT